MSSEQPDTAGRFPLKSHEIQLRVRYQETDGQGRLHHANYVNFFEVGRVEMLRASGYNYRDVERSGIYLVVIEVACQYFLPAWYDDLLTVTTTVDWAKGTRIRHTYEVRRESDLLASGSTIVASVSPSGKVLRLPTWLRT
jgi:acyl-CoA thioester hydrolase